MLGKSGNWGRADEVTEAGEVTGTGEVTGAEIVDTAEEDNDTIGLKSESYR